ncbi:MAG: hypothetical protein AABZ44_06430 [Elusimicrobiota bacterium]
MLTWTLVCVASLAAMVGLLSTAEHQLSSKVRGFWFAVSIGYLLFTLVAVTQAATGEMADLLHSFVLDYPGRAEFWSTCVLVVLGLVCGGVPLALLERSYACKSRDILLPQKRATVAAMLIAIVQGCSSLILGIGCGSLIADKQPVEAVVLAVGCALSGFTAALWICAPLSGRAVTLIEALLWGAVAGTPLLAGSLIGFYAARGAYSSLAMGMTYGAILFMFSGLLHVGRSLSDDVPVTAGLLTGFVFAWAVTLGVLYIEAAALLPI